MPINQHDVVAYRDPHGRGIKMYVVVEQVIGAGTPAVQYRVRLPPDPVGGRPLGATVVVAGATLDDTDKMLVRRPRNAGGVQAELNRRYAQMVLPAALDVQQSAGFFRGDDRDPIIMFDMGFRTRALHERPVFRARVAGAGPRPVAQNYFDIDSESGICATGRPEAAAIFPLMRPGQNVDHTYLYVLYAPRHVRTHEVQRTAREEYRATGDAVEHIDRLLFAREIVIPGSYLPGNHLFGCFRLGRYWLGDDWTAGCRLVVGRFVPNENFVHRHHARYDQVRDRVEQRVVRMPTQLGPF